MLIDFPRKLSPLFRPHRWKDVHGGRDGGKSWNVGRALIEIASMPESQLRELGLWCDGPELIVCARETMDSIRDSVHRNLKDQIERMGVSDQWDIEQSTLRNRRTQGTFLFRGLKNPDALKSLEGATRAWVEEAQRMSADSWRKVPPTVRRDNSEIWLTWNPELETDPTWQNCVLNPREGMITIQMNFSDNPWASEVLRKDREKMQREDPDEYQHIWLGQPRRQMEGAIYANELRLAESQGRIGKVEYQSGVPVYTGWDLGDGDMTAIWFIQPVMGQYRIIDYLEDSHKPMSHYLTLLEGKGYRYAKDYFPWDAASKVLIGSLEETMRQRGRNVQVLPRQSRAAGIDAVREMLGTCWFDQANCADGLQRLRYYRYGETNTIDPVTQRASQTREPLHDDNSHGADALRSFAMGHKSGKPKPATPVVDPRSTYRPRQYTPFG